MAKFFDLWTSVGNRYRQFLSGLGRIYSLDQYTNILQRGPSLRHRIRKQSFTLFAI